MRVDVVTLPLEQIDSRLAFFNRHQPLRMTAITDVIEIDHLENVGQAEADALRSQNPSQPGTIALRIDPR